jgi:hypothetical protein
MLEDLDAADALFDAVWSHDVAAVHGHLWATFRLGMTPQE